MQLVEPQVALFAEPKIDFESIRGYLEAIGAGAYEIDPNISDIENLVMIAGKACYKSFIPELNPNVTKVRDDPAAYLANINATGHGSILEHGNFTFMFWNVSRVFTHELVRHRAGTAMSQQSLRYVRLTDIDMWLPKCIKDNPEAVAMFKEAVESAEGYQKKLADLYDINNPEFNFALKKILTSSFRRIAPIGLATEIMFTMNIRTLRHLIQIRSHRTSEEEIRTVFDQVGQIMVKKCPNIFSDFKRFEHEGIGEWVCDNAAMPYDGVKIKKLKKELEELQAA